MSCVTGNCNQPTKLDPYKRVCYSRGLVLGVDEFVQEETYFLEHHRWHNRGLHGYGAVCGLDVQVRNTGSGRPEVFVSPGMALDPKGRRIRVREAQCAELDLWLERFGDDLGSPAGVGSPAEVSLYVRLCYRECSTDRVPIPSGPCRSEDETSVASRVLDDFRLEITTTPPDQTEADVVREFGRLLRQIEFTDDYPPTLTQADLEALVRSLAGDPLPGSPPIPPPPSASPGGEWRILPEDAETYLRAAFRVWVTEVRPRLLPDNQGCSAGPPAEDCILLARLDFPVADGPAGLVVDGDAGAVSIHEEDRPYLLHTQLLQELWLGGAFKAQEKGTEDHGLLLGLGDDDHPQYLLVNPATRALIADLDAAGNRVVGLANGVNAGDAMPVGQAAQQDLSGTYPGPRVVRIQGRNVLDAGPSDRNVLTWVAANNRWEPQPLPPAPIPEVPTNFEENLTRIFALSWRHNAPHDFTFILDGKLTRGLAICFGVREPGDIGVHVGVADTPQGHFIDRGSIDELSFQVFFEPHAAGAAIQRLRLQAGDLVPIKPIAAPGSPVFVEGTVIPGPYPVSPLIAAPAVFLPLPLDDNINRVYVEVSGDHVIDERGRAVDAEMLRAELPTGDRPFKSEIGIQGGQFKSWFSLGFGDRTTRPSRTKDVNLITFTELRQLDLTEAVVFGILRLRASQKDAKITDLAQLESVSGIGPQTLLRLRRQLTIGDR